MPDQFDKDQLYQISFIQYTANRSVRNQNYEDTESFIKWLLMKLFIITIFAEKMNCTSVTCNLPADSKASHIAMGFAVRQINKAEEIIQAKKKTGTITLEEILEEILANGSLEESNSDVIKPQVINHGIKSDATTRDISKSQRREDATIKACPAQNSQTIVTETTENESRNLCIICMNKERSMVYLPCSHLLTCSVCSPLSKQCPLCVQIITQTLKIYWS